MVKLAGIKPATSIHPSIQSYEALEGHGMGEETHGIVRVSSIDSLSLKNNGSTNLALKIQIAAVKSSNTLISEQSNVKSIFKLAHIV